MGYECFKHSVSVTLPKLRQNTQHPQVKGEKLYFGSQFIEVSVQSQVPAGQSNMAGAFQLKNGSRCGKKKAAKH